MSVSKRLLAALLLASLTYAYFLLILFIVVWLCGADFRSLPYMRLGTCALSAFLGGVLGTFLVRTRDATLAVLSLLVVAAALVTAWAQAAPMLSGVLAVCLVLGAWKTCLLARDMIIMSSNEARRRDEIIQVVAIVIELAALIFGLFVLT